MGGAVSFVQCALLLLCTDHAVYASLVKESGLGVRMTADTARTARAHHAVEELDARGLRVAQPDHQLPARLCDVKAGLIEILSQNTAGQCQFGPDRTIT